MKLVSDSFNDHEMMSDSELSEDYDGDPYYQDFNEEHRRKKVANDI